MKERGILFSAPMVRAILAGRKTQTRRVVNPQPAKLCRFEMNGAGTHALHLGPPSMLSGAAFSCVPVGPKYTDHRLACPHGVPGDRLWVRETWQAWRQTSYEYDEWEVETDADRMRDAKREYRATSDSAGPWRPCLFMPRWASRITLEITEIRVQRLHDISDDDARAEGVTPYTPPDGHISPDQRVPGPGFDGCRIGDQPHRLAFSDLWDSINGKAETMRDDDGEPVLDDDDRPIKTAPKAWATNPWVWAITFRRLP